MEMAIKQMGLMKLMGLMVLVTQVMSTSSKQSYRILAVIPHNRKSHWKVFEPILEELAKRGNDVTVVGHFPRETPMQNYNDVSIIDHNSSSVDFVNMDVMASNSYKKAMTDHFDSGEESVCRKGLQHPEVQRLIRSDEKYDVLLTEIFNSECFLGLVYKFKAPFVGLRTSAPSPWVNDRTANPDNPSYIPNSFTGNPSRMNFFERVENFLDTWMYKILYRRHDQVCTEIAREHFGKEMPSLEEIANNVSVVLTVTHFTYYMARPLVPGVKEISGVHIAENKPLPADLENWISGAAHGVVYFSLGSMLRIESLSSVKREAFFEAFAELPQRVLMKWEGNSTKGLPANVKTFKWSPQFDVISHPNVKAFIYHGGMLGITEAVCAGKPMILVPGFGDQPTNAALLEEKGLAVVISYSKITKDTIVAALRKVLYEPSYTETAKRMSAAFRDRLVSPLEEAVYWIEYVARHQGAPWLRTPAHGMPLYQYLLLDVIGFIMVVFSLMIFITCFIIRRLLSSFVMRTLTSQGNDVKSKEKMN